MKTLWFVLILCGFLLGSASNWLSAWFIRKEVEREVYASVSDYVTWRVKQGPDFQGFSKDDTFIIYTVAKDYHIPPELLATFKRCENGWLQNETGYNGTISATIRKRYFDPRYWPYAATADLITKIAFKYLQRPEQWGPFMETLGKDYNHTAFAREWAYNAQSVSLGYLAEGIPIKQTPANRRKKQ